MATSTRHASEPGHAVEAGLTTAADIEIKSGVRHRYHIEHHENYHADGVRCNDAACVNAWLRGEGRWHQPRLVWADDFENLVTTAGKNKYLDATLKTGLATPLWYVGLIIGPASGNTYAAGDTMASHAGWLESVQYSGSTRPAWTPGAVAAGSVDNSAAKAVFTIAGTPTNLAGCFMVDVTANSPGNTGTLLGEGNFSTGDRTGLQVGDTLSVTVTATQT